MAREGVCSGDGSGLKSSASDASKYPLSELLGLDSVPSYKACK